MPYFQQIAAPIPEPQTAPLESHIGIRLVAIGINLVMVSGMVSFMNVQRRIPGRSTTPRLPIRILWLEAEAPA